MNRFILALFAIVLPISAIAAGAQTLKVEESVQINAPADKVWEKVSNFNDLGAWHPAIKSTEIISGKNNKVGAERLLTLQDGGTIKEKLLAYNSKKMTFKYRIIEGVLPVSDYVSSVTVMPVKGGSKVVWNGAFKRKDLSDKPADGQDDATATKTMTTVYRAGLDNLKKISE